MNGNAREVAFLKELVEFVRATGALDEDDDLVELELIEQFVQLAILLVLVQLDVVLL